MVFQGPYDFEQLLALSECLRQEAGWVMGEIYPEAVPSSLVLLMADWLLLHT